MSSFFIDRPIFSWVLAIIAMLAGALSILKMPIEQYPNIAPPSVSISTSLTGASAQTLENSVTQIIEQSLTGIDNLRYFSSSSDSDGNVSITITFEPETDPDIAQVQVQNKLQAALPLLPPEVQQQGIQVSKANNNFLLVIGLYSEDDSVSEIDLGDLLLSNIKDSISRINGVGNVSVFGTPKAMRIWLNPEKLFGYKITNSDVVEAIRVQNADVAAGQIGGLPAIKNQQINATITSQSRLQTAEDFENIILRADSSGGNVLLKNVARVELGAQSYSTKSRYKRHPASGMAVILASGANALETADAVKSKMAELKKTLPAGVQIIYPLDSTPFIKLSIKSVFKTLIEAIFLVFLVMLLFLQNFRATLIPTIAVPVVLLGTFAILFTFGYTINTLTMFAVVLAIGLLVDDAIVVVENVERIMEEEGLSPVDATKKSMKQISSALIGITLVLCAVFIPMAFFGGAAGAIYRQFSITIISAMTLSVLVAMILSPSLCATILKPARKEHKLSKNKLINLFNKFLNKIRNFYTNSAGKIIGKKFRFFLIYILMIGGLIFLFERLPTSFLPVEDQGMMYLMVNTPSGSSLERTSEALEKVEDYFLTAEKDNIDHLFTVAGFSFSGRSQNSGFGFIGLKDWDQRKNSDQSVMAISGRAMGALSKIKDAFVFTFFPPPIRELGNASGFDLQLLDRENIGHEALMGARNQLLGMASKNPLLIGVRPNGLSDVAQLHIDIDYLKAISMGIPISQINQTLQTAWGGFYVNDFLDNGRIKKVYVQGEAEYRMNPEDLGKWYVKNQDGEMVAFSSFISTNWVFGSPKLERFNGVSSINIQGAPVSGESSGAAMAEMEEMVSKLPAGIDYSWSGISYEEKSSGSQTLALYLISLIVVFLALAALYESWSIPFAVILTVPFGIFGAILISTIFHMSNDVYFQVGLLTTIGLSARNAILIIEFARHLCDQGHEIVEATLIATKQRFRPIIMTSMAFILGVSPLATASGAGSASQKAIGIGVLGGMFVATFVATFFVPLFFVSVQKMFKKNKLNPVPNTEI
ncbi:MAG: hydrophobe/amphiphile efflux-1 (HAE1) family protein [Rickettsiales bacterium]|jgi:hydrophobe/amphiphile efflux-1 (HAE1) family protein